DTPAQMKIDIHAHIVERRYVDALVKDLALEPQQTPSGQTLYRRNGYTFLWERPDMYDIDARLRKMDAQGVDMRVLSLSTPNVYEWQGARQVEMARYMNDATAALVRSHPDRFAGLGSLPLDDIEASLAELDRITGELELAGVMIGSNIGGLPVNDGRFEPVWAKIDALRLPVFEHPMFPPHTGKEEFEMPLRIGFVFDTTAAAPSISCGAPTIRSSAPTRRTSMRCRSRRPTRRRFSAATRRGSSSSRSRREAAARRHRA